VITEDEIATASSPGDATPTFVVVLLLADVALVLGYLIDWRFGSRFWKATALLDLEGDANLVAWYLSVQLFLLAVFLTILAGYQREKHVKTYVLLCLLPALFAAWSFEEIAQTHKWLIYKVYRWFPFESANLQLKELTVLSLILVSICLLIGGVLARDLLIRRRRETTRFLIGILLMVGPAIAFHAADGWLPMSPGARVLTVASNRLGELLGITLMVWATFELLLANGAPLRRASPDDPPT
jgi:hypothetical protein